MKKYQISKSHESDNHVIHPDFLTYVTIGIGTSVRDYSLEWLCCYGPEKFNELFEKITGISLR